MRQQRQHDREVIEAARGLYDEQMQGRLMREYYGDSGFFNFGYWQDSTANQRQASENLVEKLLERLPAKTGRIIDVACGVGGTTRYLLKYYKPLDVIGTNISAGQLQTARRNAPDCDFILMDSARLAFQEASADSIICVEAAFHFSTRERFLQEAYRVLKSGGYLVLSDIIHSGLASRLSRRFPPENAVKDIEEYRAIYHRVGFQEIEVVDATTECWRAFSRHRMAWLRQRFLGTQKRPVVFALAWLWIGADTFLRNRRIRHYLLVSARKP